MLPKSGGNSKGPFTGTVDDGHRAIKYTRLSGVKREVYNEGAHFMLPWFESPIVYDVGAKPRSVASLTGTRELSTIYRTLGTYYDESVLLSIVNEVLKSVVAQFNVSQLITTIYSIVEAKQIAQQEAQRTFFVVERAKQENQSIIIKAEDETKSAELIGEAIKNKPGFTELEKLKLQEKLLLFKIAELFRRTYTVAANKVSQEKLVDPNQLPKTEILLKRFWKNTSITKNQDGNYLIILDKRQLKTPGGSHLIIPKTKKYLALLIAGEWESQKAVLKHHSLPLTSLVARAIDVFDKDVKEREKVITSLIKYLDTDTICYQEPFPESLVNLQKEHWDPLINWIQSTYNIEIKSTHSIIGIKQPIQSKEKLHSIINKFDGLKLAAFERATIISKSFIIGLGLVERKLSVEEAAKAARIETISQTMRWGQLENAHDIDNEDIKRQLGSAVCTLINST
ncbi:12746_t:CDS:10 [Entrophospora sp. SA101]|nr:12746_t:CDS:10 [Entrophospora sp. SA101]